MTQSLKDHHTLSAGTSGGWNKNLPYTRHLADWAPLFLRLIVGYGFMEHGFAKVMRGSDSFTGILATLGVPEPHLMAWATILIEILGGFAVLLGALVPLASIPMAAVLLVAMFTVHLPYGFSSIKLLAVTSAGAQFGPPGYETDLLYLACLAALVLGGAGPLSIDRWILKRLRHTCRLNGSSDSRMAAISSPSPTTRSIKPNADCGCPSRS